ncbi:MAG: ABC transporter ATP-binding protein [Betaproteobacteria bacterium]|nr:ABC transporter ATP-binding protein [Betaproteobacteria bacterium]
MDSFLDLEGVSFAYPAGVPVCKDISFSINPNDIGCLLGPSGCGKTTVLRLIAGFESVHRGTINLAGQLLSDASETRPPEQRRIGYVFQDFALFPHLNVQDNVQFGLGKLSPRDAQRRAAEMLDLVRLSGLERRFPHELSGGQRQRVALARALAPQPALMLLDEPFSNLDVELREKLGTEVRALLQHLRVPALLVTHDQHEAFAIADKVGVMHEGRIVQWDTPYNLYHRPASRFVADFVGEGVLLPATVDGMGCMETELGHLGCGHAGQFAAGDAVDLLLRPDDIVHDDDSPQVAEVLHKAFRGAEFLYALRLPSGAKILSLVPSHHNHEIGQRIGIRMEIDHVVAFPRA